MQKKKLYSFTEVSDLVPIQKLSLKDQFIALIKRLTTTEEDEYRSADAVSTYTLSLIADLQDFFYKATKTIRKGEHQSVTCSIASEFEPVLDEVLSSRKISNFYTATVHKPDIEYDIKYFITVRLEVKKC